MRIDREPLYEGTEIDWKVIDEHIPKDPAGRRAFLRGVYGAANAQRAADQLLPIPLPAELLDVVPPEAPPEAERPIAPPTEQ